MTAKKTTLQSIRKRLSLTLSVGLLAFGSVMPAVHAGVPGVFLDDQTFFTVEQVLLSSGSDSSNLQFALRLQNGGGSTINMNDYGVRVTDADGYSFPAQLTAKESAQVASGQSTVFRYSSKVPLNDSLDRLQVDIFKWDYDQPDLMDDLGALPVSQASGGEPIKEASIEADAIDGSLPSDAEIKFQRGRSYFVHENNEVRLYTDLYAVNNGGIGFQLPAGLKYRISAARGDSYIASVVAGADAVLPPKDKRKITLRSTVPGTSQSVDAYSLQFYTENQGNTAVLGGLDLRGSQQLSQIGEPETYLGRYGATEVVFTTVSTMASAESDGLHLYSKVEIRNNGTELVAVPPLSASFQFGTEGSVPAEGDSGTQTAYVSGKSSRYYYFHATVPSGLQPGDVKFVLFGKEGAAASSQSTSASNASGSTKTNSSSTSTDASASGTSAAAGTSAASGQFVLGITALNGAADTSNLIGSAKSYNIGDPLALESGIINSDLELSLVEFHVGKNDESDFQIGIAKFKITNKGKSAVDLPSFDTGLVGDGGAVYAGTRQTSAAKQISPNTSCVVSYSYTLPDNLSSDHLAINLSGGKGAVSMGTFQAVPQSIELGNEFQLYPYHVKLNSTALQWLYNSGNYTVQLSLDATVKRTDQVLIDSGFSPLGLELVDPLGRILARASVPFSGEQRLVSGTQTVNFGSLSANQFNSGLTLRLFETVETPSGTAKRIIKVIPNP